MDCLGALGRDKQVPKLLFDVLLWFRRGPAHGERENPDKGNSQNNPHNPPLLTKWPSERLGGDLHQVETLAACDEPT
jgi:hypothetical protein